MSAYFSLRRATAVLLALAAPLAVAGCDDAPPPATTSPDQGPTAAVTPASVAAVSGQLPEFSKIRIMLDRAGLLPALSQKKATFTLLLPRDTALAQLTPELRQALLQADPGLLTPILKGFVLDRTITADELRTRIDQGGGSFVLPTQAGHSVTFTRDGAMLLVTTPSGIASMGSEAISTDNGVVYVLDRWVAPTVQPGQHALPAAGAAPASTAAAATPAAVPED